jgi:hypothetical protein
VIVWKQQFALHINALETGAVWVYMFAKALQKNPSTPLFDIMLDSSEESSDCNFFRRFPLRVIQCCCFADMRTTIPMPAMDSFTTFGAFYVSRQGFVDR